MKHEPNQSPLKIRPDPPLSTAGWQDEFANNRPKCIYPCTFSSKLYFTFFPGNMHFYNIEKLTKENNRPICMQTKLRPITLVSFVRLIAPCHNQLVKMRRWQNYVDSTFPRIRFWLALFRRFEKTHIWKVQCLLHVHCKTFNVNFPVPENFLRNFFFQKMDLDFEICHRAKVRPCLPTSFN
jgi:hypothetical protein